ncbi:MAG: hypothetical protein JWO72_2830, partial [Caulobacteraceae bacterium]|nr:hypothetical protein [Caulobacteraceae bacterium]
VGGLVMRILSAFVVLAASGSVLAPRTVRAADALDLHGNGVDLTVDMHATAPTNAVGSQAALTTQMQTLQTHLQLGMETGANPAAGAGSGWWNSGKVDLGAVWAPTALAKVEVSALNAMRLDYNAADPVWADASQRYNRSRQSEGRAAITLTPASPLNLQVGAAASDSTVESASISGAGAVSSDLLQTQARQMFAVLTWKPLGQIRLEGAGRVESTGVYWSGARAGSYAALDPSVGATVTPWSGASWRFTLERAAEPLTADQFVGYLPAGPEQAPAGLTLQPNREWRYQAAVEQKAGGVDLTASVLHASLQRYAYQAPYGLEPGRTDIGSGERSEVRAGVAAPLSLFGVPQLSVQASGAWRASMAADPLTGTLGRLSGESPYDASLSLTQAARGLNMRWGVTAVAAGPARSYMASQVSSRSATAGLGGFWEYHPGGLTVHLQLDNLLGGDRLQRDVYYAGTRDLNVVDRVDQSRAADRAVRISLIRPL